MATVVEVEEALVVEAGEAAEHVVELPVGRGARNSPSTHEPAVVLDPAHELVELEQHQPAVGAELDDVALDLLGDPPHHLGPLQDRWRRRAP